MGEAFFWQRKRGSTLCALVIIFEPRAYILVGMRDELTWRGFGVGPKRGWLVDVWTHRQDRLKIRGLSPGITIVCR